MRQSPKCINCKWFETWWQSWVGIDLRKCKNLNSNINMIGQYPLAINERTFGNCGPFGKLYEEK